MNKKELIEELLADLCVLHNDGLPNLRSDKSISYISEFFNERGMWETGQMIIENLFEDDKEFKNPDLNKVIPYENVNGEKAKGKVGNLLRRPEKEDAHIQALKALGGKNSDRYKKAMDDLGAEGQPNRDIEGEREKGEEKSGEDAPEQNIKGPDSFSHAPDIQRKKDVDQDRENLPPNSKAVDVPKEKIGKVEEGGDSQVKNDMLNYGYTQYEKKTKKKPAPGGAGSAFNEIVSGELVHILRENPNMTEEELADYCQKRFGSSTLGKEQKETAGIDRSPELEKRRKAAIGNGTTKKPEFPKLLKEIEQERATYSKSRIAARSAKAKFERTEQRVSNLQDAGKFGKETKLHTFYGAEDSLSAQIDIVDKVNKVLLPDGTEVDKEDLKEFIRQGGGGMNPSDTATFVTDETGNLLVQFHSDKTTTADIQDNSTLAKEEDLYKSYIERTSLSDEDKQKANEINSEYAKKIIKIEEEYNNQSKGIAEGLLQLDLDKQANIVDNDKGTLQKNLDIAIYGEAAYKRDDFDSISSEFQPYLPDGVSAKDLTNRQKLEILYRFTADGGNLTAVKVKPINKVALQYEKENPYAQGINVKTILSKQRESVVNLQRERIEMLNNFNSDVDGVSVPVGTLMEAEESIRGFHLTLMDYPPKGYTKGDPSSIVGSALDVNMGGVVVNGQTLRQCLGVQDTTEFKQKFRLVNEEKLTYDDVGNVTGKVVFTYMVGSDGNQKEIGFKTYRSKTGATGKTSNTMAYSTEMQDCFKKNQ
jgi:hypothetical protein